MPYTGIQRDGLFLDRVGEGWHNRGMTNRDDFDSLASTAHDGQVLAATLNADDTSIEEGFEPDSPRWFEVATMTLADLLDQGINPHPDYIER